MDDDDLFDLLGEDFSLPAKKDEPVKESPKIQKLSGGEFEKFAKNIVGSLISDNIPPTPTNYEIYFKSMLGSKSSTFKKKINDLMEFETPDDADKRVSMEQEIKKSYEAVNLIFQHCVGMYKQLERVKDTFKKKEASLEIAEGKLGVKNIIESLNMEVEKSLITFSRYQEEIKQSYDEMRSIYKFIEEKSDYDTAFGVHNRRFFDANLLKSIESKKKYGYFTTLMFLRVADLNCTLKEQNYILKNVCKIINKRLNHGNFLTHLEQEYFVLTMQHTNIEKAQKICEKLIESIQDATFFIRDSEISANLEVVLAEVTQECDPKELMKNALASLEQSGRDKEPFVILNA